MIGEPDSVAAQSFMTLADTVADAIALSAHRSALANKGKIPLMHVK